jgi:hypothetical protein
VRLQQSYEGVAVANEQNFLVCYLAVDDLAADADPNGVLAELMVRFGGPEMAASEALTVTTLGYSFPQRLQPD